MEMFLKLFLIIIIRCTQAEPLFRTVHGNGGDQVTACSVNGARCEGVVLHSDWVVVLHSCIHAQNTKQIYVQKGVVNCTQDTNLKKTEDSSVRSVIARFSHPMAPNVDIALLRLDWPYVEDLRNGTQPYNALSIMDVWMESILYPPTEKTPNDDTESSTQIEYRMYSSPIKMFFATVILPSASFILFFLFIIFHTGTKDDTRNIPYKSLNNEKESSHV